MRYPNLEREAESRNFMGFGRPRTKPYLIPCVRHTVNIIIRRTLNEHEMQYRNYYIISPGLIF